MAINKGRDRSHEGLTPAGMNWVRTAVASTRPARPRCSVRGPHRIIYTPLPVSSYNAEMNCPAGTPLARADALKLPRLTDSELFCQWAIALLEWVMRAQ
jgi:hypothetical protein